MNASLVLLPACANWSPGKPPCDRLGRGACGNCKLVIYCQADCQKAHWPEHKKVCKSPMGKDNWRPAWDREGREPPWASGPAAKNWHNVFGGDKYLWGNTPALDILKLEQNEGLSYQDDIALLFAASGDLRHVVNTIASLPDGMTQQVNITMNDREFDVVARNTILLLLALTAQDATDIEGTAMPLDLAEALIHVWYSALVPSSIILRLEDRVKPMITDVCSRIANKPPNSILAKTWEFSTGRTLRLVLKKEDWLKLPEFLHIPNGMTRADATQIRRAVTLAPERADYRDRWYFKDASPFMRIAKQRFQEDGLLLPFGHPRLAFDVPNPTIFQNAQSWPMGDKADPSDGWPVLDVQRTSSLAIRDWYGKLFVYLYGVFQRFLHRLKTIRISFDLYNVDVNELPQHLEFDKYSRIEVANICDAGYIGIRKTLSLLTPSLQSPRKNPHATFITLFINAVMEILKMGDKREQTPDIEILTKYLPFSQISSQLMTSLMMKNANNWMNGAEMSRIWDARCLALDVNKHFERYMVLHGFETISADLGVEIKSINTVVEEWPTQLKLQIGQEGAEEEFRLLLGSGSTNIERYVEWRRAD